MLEINQKNIERKEGFSIVTIPKSLNFGGYKTKIPNKFIKTNGFQRIISLPDNQPLKLKKENEVIEKTILEIKRK